MDEDLITNPRWSQRRQNRATAFRFIFQWEMNPTDDLNRDLNDFIHRLGKSDDYFSYAIELVDGIIEKKEIIDSTRLFFPLRLPATISAFSYNNKSIIFFRSKQKNWSSES